MSASHALAAFAAAFCLACAQPSAAAPVPAAPAVGYQSLSMPDPEGPPVEVDIWYPTSGVAAPRPIGPFVETVATDGPLAGDRLPLIVISHGNGGSATSHVDTAMALAKAGFVVAALTHSGDNYRDQSRAVDMANRPRQLKLLVDYVLKDWAQHGRIDADVRALLRGGELLDGLDLRGKVEGRLLTVRRLDRRRPQLRDRLRCRSGSHPG